MKIWKRVALSTLAVLWGVGLIARHPAALSALILAGCLLSGWVIWSTTGSASGQGRREGGS